ncbi:MAG: hypothetical protein AABZ47_15295 [Planctomycetota bacterium]
MSDPRINSVFSQLPGSFTEAGSFSASTATPTDTPDFGAPNEYNRRPTPLLVYAETERNSNVFALEEFVACTRITRAIDGGDTTALLSTAFSIEDRSSPRPRNLSTILSDLHPNRRIRVAQPHGASGERILFQGVPITHTLRFSHDGESATILCLSEGQEALRFDVQALIDGRLVRQYPLSPWNAEQPDAFKLSTLTAIFNAEGKPNRSRELYPVTIGDHTVRLPLFAEGNTIDVTTWRYVDALRYVLGWYVARHVTLSGKCAVIEFLLDTETMLDAGDGVQSDDPLVARLTSPMAELGVASTNVEEALTLICAAASVHYEIAVRQQQPGDGSSAAKFFLRVFAVLDSDRAAQATPTRRMGSARRSNLPRESAFFDPTSPLRSVRDMATANAAQQNDLTIDRRTIAIPNYLGGVHEFEVFLILRPGWEPHPNLDNLTSVEAKDDAVEYWIEQFYPEYEEDEEDKKTPTPTSVYHGKHPQHDSAYYENSAGSLSRVRDAFRKWIFPDDVSYLDGAIGASRLARIDWSAKWYSPYYPGDGTDTPRNVLVHPMHGAGIAGAANWLPRRRPFGETIGRRDAQGNRAPIVYFHYDAPNKEAIAANGWIPFAGGVRIDSERAAIILTENKLFGSSAMRMDENGDAEEETAIYAHIHGTFAVGIVCTIQGDERMSYSPGGALFGRALVHDWGFEKFRKRNRRGQNSLLNAQAIDPDAEYEDRDDTAAFEKQSSVDGGRRILETVAGTVTVPWIDTRYSPGDSFSGVEGLALSFAASPGIVAITYIADDPNYRTEIQLEDFRQAPEVGAEA